ncbi:XisH family protein [Aphanothece sacrum]|uniref:FdxN element excision controlling factor protein n=1 Tax=Aphanothece sacrum FPU1 TaxID=1920663 RepID=A0A401IGP4_APHSA|nr:XisH family protein [Aphanothece sacrum]GBF80453.1 FdxN element excision controlling factor protein [Aphanothece sacrum FPU1]GBF85534.1 FdxN element excision controlling factor protein XisH [Aphanothece sacrum FPU3]
MSAKDVVHEIVRDALEKDSWIITHDPFFLRVSEKIGIFIDLAASKLLIAEKETIKIAVEVKSFIGLSAVTDFHLAVGQFLNYRLALEEFEPDRILYLAIPDDIYQNFFKDSFIQKIIKNYSIKLIIVNPKKGEIILWKPSPINN